jgi:riboflavin biosynthesis pyrimidine reductase
VRALLPLPAGTPDLATPEGLAAAYSLPRLPFVRAGFIAGVDGAATIDGRSGGLGSDADRAVFATLRDLADVVLVGAGTVRVEGYRPPRPSAERRARRVAAGRAEVPVIAIVSSRLDLDPTAPLFAAAEVAPVILTTDEAAATPFPGAEVVGCGARRVDVGRTVDVLVERGLGSIVCEGGPTLFAQLVAAGRVDELCLTVSPVLAGPGAGRITSGDAWDGPRPVRLAGLLEDGGLLFARYSFDH